ncbi:MAG: DUF5777 family beta-barrel protein [Betaproteobacteria bacterium]
MLRLRVSLLIVSLLSIVCAPSAHAQDAPDNDDAVLKPAQPDFTLVSLPTGLRLPRFGSAFRVTHRFTRPLGDGSFGDLAGDLFGLDSGAQIGLEYRFGIVPNGQIGIHRTSDKTIEFFGQYGAVRQDQGLPFDVSALVSVEGTNNFRDEYSPSLGAIVSRTVSTHAAFYAEPIWVHHSNVHRLAGEPVRDTFFVGLGARLRIRPTLYVVGEFAPRAAGYRPGVSHGGFALEKRVGGHVFQINFSDSFATTTGQIARGGTSSSDWYIGFNISRKFY